MVKNEFGSAILHSFGFIYDDETASLAKDMLFQFVISCRQLNKTV